MRNRAIKNAVMSPAMSALGQKQTCAVQNAMSALSPKADMQADILSAREPPRDGKEKRVPASELRSYACRGPLLALRDQLLINPLPVVPSLRELRSLRVRALVSVLF